MKYALILGGAGFIGAALARRLKDEGHWVRIVDIHYPPKDFTAYHEFVKSDLRHDTLAVMAACRPVRATSGWDEVYQFACDMGGAGYIFTGEHDADVIRNNVLINASVARYFANYPDDLGRLLYTSSSCVYNDTFADESAMLDDGFRLEEWHADIGFPSNAYGWEKRFSEELWLAHKRNFGLNVCISRFSTIYGPGSAYDNGREKAVAAIIRKVLDAPDGGEVEVWGDGEQIRPLVYIDDLLAALTGLVRRGDLIGPVNLASDEFTSCDDIAREAISLSNKRLTIKHVPGPIGKKSLLMSTELARNKLGWQATTPFSAGIERTFEWIAKQKAMEA